MKFNLLSFIGNHELTMNNSFTVFINVTLINFEHLNNDQYYTYKLTLTKINKCNKQCSLTVPNAINNVNTVTFN